MVYMKVSLGVAVLAVFAGMGSMNTMLPAAVPWCSFGVAFAACTFAAWRAWKILLKVLGCLETAAEKLTYMERRMDKGQAHIPDVCRHLSQVLQEFDEAQNAAEGHMKWWWVSRRVRDLYEALGSSLISNGAPMESVEKIWSMVQLEVFLRNCRDYVAEKMNKLKYPEQYDEDGAVSYGHALKNMKEGASYIDMWNPMKPEDVQNVQPATPWEKVLKSQILERIEELTVYKVQAGKMKADLFEGTFYEVSGSSS